VNRTPFLSHMLKATTNLRDRLSETPQPCAACALTLDTRHDTRRPIVGVAFGSRLTKRSKLVCWIKRSRFACSDVRLGPASAGCFPLVKRNFSTTDSRPCMNNLLFLSFFARWCLKAAPVAHRLVLGRFDCFYFFLFMSITL